MRWTNGGLLLAAAVLAAQTLPRAAQKSSGVHGSPRCCENLTGVSASLVQAGIGAQPPAIPVLSATPPQTAKHDLPEFFIMIDPGHGGDDHGTTLPGKLEEKDLTLLLARQLRRQCEERGIQVRLLRESDVNLSLDRRAETSNQQHAAMYISLHAAPTGKGVRIYTAALAPVVPVASQFLNWDAAQSAALQQSRMLARKVSDELHKSQFQVTLLTAPLRPLNNVAVPAISVEWATGAEDFKAHQAAKSSARLTAAVAEGLAQARSSLGESR